MKTMRITGWRLYDEYGILLNWGVLRDDETLFLDGIHRDIDTTSDRHPSEVQKFLDRNYAELKLKFEYNTKEVKI